MATVIRFARHGSKKKPIYRIVVQNKTSPRDGRFIDRLGTFDPIKGEESLVLVQERLEYWVSKGAIMSPSVESQVNKAKRAGRSTAPPAPKKAAAQAQEAR
ncbi:30S ribosomal protein S16 [bacterium]|nr:30S ribosomal protein S16 [bacterium]